jgi:hypothetical protein
MEDQLTPETMQLTDVPPPGFLASGKSLIHEIEKLRVEINSDARSVAEVGGRAPNKIGVTHHERGCTVICTLKLFERHLAEFKERQAKREARARKRSEKLLKNRQRKYRRQRPIRQRKEVAELLRTVRILMSDPDWE